MKYTVLSAIAILSIYGAAMAQNGTPEPMKRTVLQRADVSIPGREGLSVLVEFGWRRDRLHYRGTRRVDY